MKPPSVPRLSPTVPAAFSAAIGISLSIFLLPGAGVQGVPTPLLPAIGGAAGRVAADLPAIANKRRASGPVANPASFTQPVATRTEHFVPQRRQAATRVHRAHRPAPTRVVGGAPAPVPVVPPPAPATPVATIAGAPAPPAHGHGKALGRSREHPHGVPPGHAKKAPTAPAPVPGAPPKANGGGNGHKGGKK
jgi:hypothetical protein